MQGVRKQIKPLEIRGMRKQKVRDYSLNCGNGEGIGADRAHDEIGRDGELGHLGVEISPSLRKNGASDSLFNGEFC